MENDRKHNRRSTRLKGYDYSPPGASFETIVTKDRACLFGEVVDGDLVLNEYGKQAKFVWERIPDHFHHVTLDGYVIMPDHVHGIIFIDENDDNHEMVGARQERVKDRIDRFLPHPYFGCHPYSCFRVKDFLAGNSG